MIGAIWALVTAPFMLFIIGLAIACIAVVAIIDRSNTNRKK
jgi:hypothetical protein